MAWRTWARDPLYQRHTHYRWRSISRLEYDPSVNQTAESYFKTKINKKSKAVRDKTGRQSQIQWYKLKVVTIKHEDVNLMFTKHRKEDGIYPLKRDSKAQDKDQRSIVTTCKNTYRGFAFSTYCEHNSAIYRWNLIIPASLQDRAISWYHCYLQHPSHSSLQETTNSLKSEKVCTYHPVEQILQILPKTRDTAKIWYCTIKTVHNDSPKSVMCTPHEVIHNYIQRQHKY